MAIYVVFFKIPGREAMKKPLTLIVFLTVLVLFNSSVYGQGTGKQSTSKKDASLPSDLVLKVGYFEYPGLTYTDASGKPAGFVNEITMKTLEHAGIKYTIASYPAARFFEYVAQGKIDFFNGLSSIETVNKSMIASKINVFPLNMRVYSLQGAPHIKKKEDLRGHTVILVRGFTYKDWGKWIRDKANGITFYETETHEAAFEMLKRGRGDYLLNYKYIDDECLKKVSIPNLIVMTPPEDTQWYCSFNISRKTLHARQILNRLDNSYLQLIKEGQLKKYN